jgi:hypothetical protein
MDSSVEITDSGEFETIINNLHESLKRIGELFGNSKYNVQRIENPNIWSGENKELTYEKLRILTDCFNPVEESLNLYLQFLENVLQSYKNFEETINTGVENNTENLDVNSL